MTSLIFIVANDIADIASSACKPEGRRWPPAFRFAENSFPMLLLERESPVGLHGSTVVGERRNLAHAWIGDARRKSCATQFLIGQTKAWKVQEILAER